MREIDAVPQGVSVCVPTHRGRGRYVKELLQSAPAAIAAAGCPVEIIIVDSATGSEATDLARVCRQLGAIYLRGPKPAAAKRNLAVAHSTYNTLLFVDSDCLFTKQSIAAHVAAQADAADDIAGIAGRTVMVGDTNPVWNLLDYSRLHNTCFDYTEMYGQVGWGVTCNLSMRKEVFEKVGGFCEDVYTPMGGEDVDLGLRTCDLGYRWLTSAEAIVEHRRDPISHHHQVLSKLYTYGRADVFLTSRHTVRRQWYANPVSVSVLAGVAAALFAPKRRATAGLAAASLPLLLSATADAVGSDDRETVYGQRWAGSPRSGFGTLLKRAVGGVIDLAFHAGVTVEAVRRRRPDLAFQHFVYADEREFVSSAGDSEAVQPR